MKKQDLKNGMHVEYREGSLRLISMFDLKDENFETCNSIVNYDDDLNYERYNSRKLDIVKVYDWQHNLLWERKELPKLSKDEKTILEAVVEKTKAKYIARDFNGELWAFELRPEKKKEIWVDKDNSSLRLNYVEILFKFIKWENKEPYYIPDLLKE